MRTAPPRGSPSKGGTDACVHSALLRHFCFNGVFFWRCSRRSLQHRRVAVAMDCGWSSMSFGGRQTWLVRVVPTSTLVHGVWKIRDIHWISSSVAEVYVTRHCERGACYAENATNFKLIAMFHSPRVLSAKSHTGFACTTWSTRTQCLSLRT